VRDLTENARDLDESDLSARIPEAGNDEIAQLARTYNAMLDRLQGAFETQRRFVDDAGHELRTPITIVRGHLELMGDDPADRRETIELVTDELDRMARIVDDLLVLARAEQPHFVNREPTDLAALTTGLLERARAMGDRPWVFDGTAEGWFEADPQRLTQAVLNLVRNAVEHTAEGQEIGLGSAWVGNEVHLWVRDHGPGVPVEDREHLFERFHRGASARRRSEGAGLGLAIVSAIVDAHGGQVTLGCPDSGGSVFMISVPAGPGATRPAPSDPTVGAGFADPTVPLDPTKEPTWPGS
nr:HAMP domain-containing histidine kinase [Acidimicrobiia bacterium]